MGEGVKDSKQDYYEKFPVTDPFFKILKNCQVIIQKELINYHNRLIIK